MTNEKRTTITMEDLKNSDGLEYLNYLLDQIEITTAIIRNVSDVLDAKIAEGKQPHEDRSMVMLTDKIRRYDEIRCTLLGELGTEYLICDLDTEVRDYINERLNELH